MKPFGWSSLAWGVVLWVSGLIFTSGCSGDRAADAPTTGTPAPVSEADQTFTEE